MNDLQNEILFSGRNAYLINSARRNYDAQEARVRQKDDWFPIPEKNGKTPSPINQRNSDPESIIRF